MAASSKPPKLHLNDYEGFLLDVDGVIVLDKTPIPGSIEAVAALQKIGKVLFFSNNSALSRANYALKLQELGIQVSAEDILNSGALVAKYLSHHEKEATVFVIGAQGLKDEIAQEGHALSEERAAWMVTGQDQSFNYEKLDRGLQVLLGQARWVASGADGTFPSEDGLKPGAGSIVGAFRGMGFEPEAIVGKPSLFSMKQALDVLKISDSKRVLVIGDRLDTDIQGANIMSLDSLLVLSGVTSETMLQQSDVRPTFTTENLAIAVNQ